MDKLSHSLKGDIRNSGFTLVEMMIVILLSGLIIAALYSAHRTQQRSQTAQDQIVEMQQNLRSGFNFLQREIRMAGFEPVLGADAGIVTATNSSFVFTQDINDNGANTDPGDGDVADNGETITYGLANDADSDGIVDGGGISSLTRLAFGGIAAQPVADNIEAVEFLYLLGDDLTPSLNPSAGELDTIRTVVISMLARTRFPDPDFSGSANLLPASNDPNFHNGDYNLGSGVIWGNNDNFRRRILIATVQLRNMGL